MAALAALSGTCGGCVAEGGVAPGQEQRALEALDRYVQGLDRAARALPCGHGGACHDGPHGLPHPPPGRPTGHARGGRGREGEAAGPELMPELGGPAGEQAADPLRRANACQGGTP